MPEWPFAAHRYKHPRKDYVITESFGAFVTFPFAINCTKAVPEGLAANMEIVPVPDLLLLHPLLYKVRYTVQLYRNIFSL